MKWIHAVLRASLAFACLSSLCLAPASAGGSKPEDLLKGRIIVSDVRLPTSWHSVSSYVSEMKAKNKTTIWYDKKTGKVKIEYAAFFGKPLQDVQVNLVIYDITGGRAEHKATTEQFMNRGDRVLFNSVMFDKEDFEMNKKYRLVIESRHAALATGEFTLRGEGPHYSGKVQFTDDEAKGKD